MGFKKVSYGEEEVAIPSLRLCHRVCLLETYSIDSGRNAH